MPPFKSTPLCEAGLGTVGGDSFRLARALQTAISSNSLICPDSTNGVSGTFTAKAALALASAVTTRVASVLTIDFAIAVSRRERSAGQNDVFRSQRVSAVSSGCVINL